MKRAWETGWKTMAWFTHVLTYWIGFICQNYIDLFWMVIIMLLCIICTPPVLLIFVLYCVSFVTYIYKKINNIPEDILSNSWHKLRHSLASGCLRLGKIMYDHEIIGLEHIPEGPGLIIFYHGIFDIDCVLLMSTLYAKRRQLCIVLADKALFYIPGLRSVLTVTPCTCGSKAECVEILKKGYLLAIAPGGGRECFFSDNHYKLLWGKRTGFAQIALEAKVPIIPMFTQNIQEAARGFGRIRLMRWLYEKTRVIGVPAYGGFPVKLRTYLGEPIPYDPNITAVELAGKTKAAIENLRDHYQKIPGSILRAIAERFGKKHKDD